MPSALEALAYNESVLRSSLKSENDCTCKKCAGTSSYLPPTPWGRGLFLMCQKKSDAHMSLGNVIADDKYASLAIKKIRKMTPVQ